MTDIRNILITGASGFLGRHIVAELRQQGYTVDTLGRSHNNDVVADLQEAIPQLGSNRYDLVIHAAGKAHSIPRSAEEENLFFRVNELGTQYLCQALHPPRYFVFISSVSVYGLEHGEMIKETAPLLGKSPYAASKINAEAYLQQWTKQHNVVLTILRLPLVTGFRAPGNLQAMHRALKGGWYFIIGKGAERKSMVAAADVAKWIIPAARMGGTYHLTDGRHPSMQQIALAVASQWGRKKVNSIPRRLARFLAAVGELLGKRSPVNKAKLQKLTATLTFDDTKARRAFGYNPGSALDTFKPSPE